MKHYHIRWINSNLDWQAFQTEDQAKEEAEQLKHPNEKYVIEAYDGDCTRCQEIQSKTSVRSKR